MSTFAAIPFVAILCVASTAEAQVAVGDFSGARASRVRSEVFSRLQRAGVDLVPLRDSSGDDAAAVAANTNATAVIFGNVRRRRGRWQGSAQIYDASGTQIAEVDASARASGGFAVQLASRLASALESLPTGDAPEPAPIVADGNTRRVAVGDITGRGAARIRNQLVRAVSGLEGVEVVPKDDLQSTASRLGVSAEDAAGLQAIALDMQLSALVEGSVERRGRRWTARIMVRDGSSGGAVGEAEYTGRSAGRVATAVRRGGDEIGGYIAQTNAPEPEPEPEPEPDLTDDPDDRVGRREPTPRDTSDRPNAIELTIWGGATGRVLDYNDDIHNRLRRYQLSAGPTIAFGVRWYPAAHFTSNFAANIGLDLHYERMFGVESARRLSDGSNYIFPTNSQAYSFGLRVRYPLLAHEFSIAASYGGHAYRIEPGPATGFSNIPEVPRANYQHVRFGAEARLAPVAGLRVTINGGYRYILDAGGIQDDVWFPRSSVAGADVGGRIGYELDVGIEIWAGVQYRRYWYSMNPEPLDPWIAGGAVDQYTSYTGGITWRR